MKLRIVKDFRDKYTGVKYKAGDIRTFDDARAKELLAHPQGIVSVEEEDVPTPTVEDTPEAPEEVEVEKPKSKKKK